MSRDRISTRAAMVLLAATASGPAQAATYYVATNGNDASTGTIAAPWATIQHAANTVAAGDTVCVRGGTYNEHAVINSSGTLAAYTWYHPYTGETAIVDGTGLAANLDLVAISGNYVRFDGFEVRNSTGNGIAPWDNHHIQIINNVVHDNSNTGITCGEDTGKTNCHDNLIQSNTVYRNCLRNSATPGSTGGGWGQGISVIADLTTNRNTTVQWNTVYNNWGEGIGSQHTRGTIISSNAVYDNFSVEIYVDGSPNVIVSGNFTYWTGDARFTNVLSGAGPIGLATSIELANGSLDGNVWMNNIDVGSREGFRYFPEHTGAGYPGLANNLIANNTFVNEGTDAIRVNPYIGQNTNDTLVNNIFYRSPSGTLVGSGSSAAGISCNHNCWSGGSAGVFAGSGDVNANPQLLHPGTFVPTDYKLSNTSPCRIAGSSLAAVPVDFFGSPRTVPYSIGAQENDASPDSVGDGIPDSWRARYFGGNGTTTNAQSCATCDADGTGQNNFFKYLAGLNPTNPASVFKITSAVPTGANFIVMWQTAGPRTNVVQASNGGPGGGYNTNFLDLSTPGATIFISTTGDTTTNYTDVGGATNFPSRFYRIRLAP